MTGNIVLAVLLDGQALESFRKLVKVLADCRERIGIIEEFLSSAGCLAA